MKTTIIQVLSTMALSGLLLTSCGSKENDPSGGGGSGNSGVPKIHDVEVRYQGANLTGLGTKVSFTSVFPDGSNSITAFTDAPTGTTQVVSRTIGKLTGARNAALTVTMEGVKSPAKVPTNSYIVADLYVDGVKTKTARIDNTTTFTTTPVVTATIDSKEWY